MVADATASVPGGLRFRVDRSRSCRDACGLHTRGEAGLALIAVILVMTFIGVLAGGLVLLASGEALMAGNHRDAVAAEAAAGAALEVAVTELRRVADWNLVLGGAVAAGFVDGATTPLVGGRPVDLVRETASVQARSGGAWGADAPVWVLFAHGPVTALGAGVPPSDSGLYLVTWVADDGGDGDGDPRVDRNGVVQIRAEARGSGGLRRVVLGVVGRVEPAPAALQRLGWRYGS
jgi:hypothetical protein